MIRASSFDKSAAMDPDYYGEIVAAAMRTNDIEGEAVLRNLQNENSESA
jgi:hypothetical protein